MKLIPELRFPEFEKDGEWEIKELQILADRIIKKNKDGKIDKVFTNSAAHGIVDQREYFDKDIANKSNLENYYIVESGDYVYNPRISTEAPVGPTSRNNIGHTGVMSPLYTVFRFKDKENQFFEYYFNSRHWYDSIRKASNTGARFDRMSITDSVFMAIPILCPIPQEQQKIASCLSSLDELIAAHNDKLDALKDHKKGLLQNLFPQEGETVPRVRFPEFEGDGEWIETSLSEISPSIFDGTHQTPKYTDDGIPFFSVENIVSGTKNKFISREDYIEATKKNKPEEGDVLVTRIGSIGIPKVVDWDYEFSIYVTLAVIKKSDQFISQYLASYIQSSRFQKEILRRSLLKAAPQKINMNELRECEILLPPDEDKQEQQKIASCLSAVDELITAQQEKIEQLQQHKKGLMQGLFPKMTD